MKQALLFIILVWGAVLTGHAQEENGFELDLSQMPDEVVRDSVYSFSIPLEFTGDTSHNTKIHLVYAINNGSPQFDMEHREQSEKFSVSPQDNRDTINVDTFRFSSAKVDKGVNVVEIWPATPDTTVLGDTATKQITAVDNSTGGLHNPKNQDLKIYPNPTSQKLKLNSNHWELKELTIFNDQGKQVKSFSKPAQSVLVGDLPKGLYILKARLTSQSLDEAVITKKLILNR